MLLIPGTGPDSDPSRPHLFVILTETDAERNTLLVPVCSARGRFDGSCILSVGDHDRIIHRSFVAYNLMNIYSADLLGRRIGRRDIVKAGVLSAHVFALVCAGIDKSSLSAPRYKKFYRSFLAGGS